MVLTLGKDKSVAEATFVHGIKTFTDSFIEEFGKEIDFNKHNIEIILKAQAYYLKYSNGSHAANMVFRGKE